MHVVVAKARFTRAQRRRSDVIHFEVRMRGANDIADAAKSLEELVFIVFRRRVRLNRLVQFTSRMLSAADEA